MRRIASALCAAALAALAVGCSERQPGSIARVPMTVPLLGETPRATLTVALPTDARPLLEHEGGRSQMHIFFTLLVVTHWEKAGNYVTDDETATLNAPAELRGVLETALATSHAAAVAPEGVPTGFVLETEIEHLYATHYAADDGTVWVIPGRRGPPEGGGATTKGRQYGSYGDVELHARLIDRRTAPPAVVWDEYVVGSGEAAPAKNHLDAAQAALRVAVGDAAATLAIRVGAALERIGMGASRPAAPLDAGLPSTFLIERVSRFRDFIEVATIDTRKGRVLAHLITPLKDHGYARPGEWILSRHTQDGSLLSGDAYDAFAHALASRYDLRTYDDVSRYHFFGTKAASAH